jgi:hypothetical protein
MGTVRGLPKAIGGERAKVTDHTSLTFRHRPAAS